MERCSNRVTVGLIDSHEVVRAGVRTALSECSNLDVVWEVGPEGATSEIPDPSPHVLIFDPDAFEPPCGPAAARKSGNAPPPGLVAFADHASPEQLRNALRLGAKAYVLKSDPATILPMAVQAVASGRYFISPGLSDVVRDIVLTGGQASLTNRERTILSLIGEGHSSKSIANRLGLSARTVEVHRLHLMRKLGARSSAELVRLAIRHGLLTT